MMSNNNTAPTINSLNPKFSGLVGGVRVTITGTNLSNINAVNFDEAGATMVGSPTDSAIVVIAPNTGTAGSVDVTLIDTSGKHHAFSDQFTYELPQVLSVVPSSGSLQGSETVTLKGKYLSGALAVNFGVLGASNVNVISDTEVTVTNAGAPKDESVQVQAIVQGQPSTKTATFTYSAADAAPVPMVFKALDTDSTYIQFITDKSLDGFYYDSTGDKVSLSANTAYPLSSLVSTKAIVSGAPTGVPAVAVREFSGRVYVNFGSQGLQGLSTEYTPSASNPLDANYDVRYQYYEPTIKNGQLNIDLSYIDFTSISLSLKAKNAPNASNPNQLSVSSSRLAAATGNSASSANASVLPNANDQLPSANFARVISPQLSQTVCYHDFSKYLLALNGTSARIAGTYVGTGDQPSGNPETQAQSYDYTATFSIKQDKTTKAISGSVTLVPSTDSGNGCAAGVPAVQQGLGVGPSTGNIVLDYADLNAATGIYGCNAPYTLNGGAKTAGITNDVYGQVVGDLFSGLNFGYIGSSELFNGAPINTLCSTEWWGGVMPDGTNVVSGSTPGGTGMYFGGVQSDSDFYNSYAGSIATLTAGYGFPLQDRLGKNLMAMNTETDQSAYLEVWIDQEVT
ncbi:hypothetical protein GV054_12165 [Marinomonas mediterranea]|nr:IPT/TIG domain-containing protein [Marinomonas mediterranea]WCN13701.1 hypothetical protein GV054_12165 [Marinomonas mediterranea]